MSFPRGHPLLVLFAAFVTAALAEFLWLGWLEFPERRFADLWIAAQANDRKSDPDIIVLDVDEASLEEVSDDAGR